MREVKQSTATPGAQGGTALARAVTLHLEGKGREALKELDRAVESGDPPREVYAAKGHIQFELELYEEAVKSYESLLGLDPNSTSAYFNLAVCQEKLGRWSESAANFQRALSSDEGRLDARLGLGVCLLHMKQAEKALECFEVVLKKTPTEETPLFGKAVALELIGKQDEALEIYRTILAANPHAEEPLANTIHIGMRNNDTALVRESSEKLLTLRPFSQAAL
ncbi:MAG: tetratricopeptide repeat protein, partial [Bryobacteraceae bacterium]|nr:tetratricopeptide repeat protein [Bryobacteraceae bacterium]